MVPTTSKGAQLPPADDGYDSADDPDFAPQPKAAKGRKQRARSGSLTGSTSGASSSSEGEGEGRLHKRTRTTVATRSGHVYGLDDAGSSRRAASPPTGGQNGQRLTFAQLQALDRQRTEELLAASNGKGKAKATARAGEEEMVHVRVLRRYAGQDVWEEKAVPASSKDAQIWGDDSSAARGDPTGSTSADASLLSAPPDDAPLCLSSVASSSAATESNSRSSTIPLGDSESTAPLPPPLPGPTRTMLGSASLSPSATTDGPPPPARPEPPKKRKTGGGLAAATLALKNKGKKMSTLEKSAMDWRKHRAQELTEEERHQLARNRQAGGGGFLEKQEFLERVSDQRWG